MSLKDEVIEIKDEVDKIQNKSFAMELLKDQKKQNKRMFVIILVILTMWFTTIGYLFYVLNDVNTETITQENEDGYNNYVGNDGDITNGEANN